MAPAEWDRQTEAEASLSTAFKIRPPKLPRLDWPEAEQEAQLALQKGRARGCQCLCPLPRPGCSSSGINGAVCPHLSLPLHKLETTNLAIFSAALTATRL